MKKRTIVCGRAKVTGRVALVKPTSVLMNSEQRPVVEGLGKDVKFIPIEFDGSDQIIDGIQRSFWVADITRADFRWLLSRNKSSNWEGSDSLYRIYPAGPAKDLIQLAFTNLPELVAEEADLEKQNAA